MLDSPIRVSASAAACDAARALWRGTLADSASGTAAAEVAVNVHLDVAESLAEIATRINAAVLEATCRLTVHAGVVASGRAAIVLPAVSGAGKSTLTAACVRAGLTYVSDEAFSISARDNATPYPRPVGLSEHSAALLGVQEFGVSAGAERLIAPEDLGAVARDEVPVTHVIKISRRNGATPALESLPALDAVHLLLSNAFNHYRAPADAVYAVSRIAGSARVWRLVYGEAPDAAHVLASLLD